MNYLTYWLERLKSRPASEDNWKEHLRYEAREALSIGAGEGDWLTLSTHHNGFVREVAVRELCKHPSASTLVALLERANDWVPQVRELAAAGVQRYLGAKHAPAWLYALPQLLALTDRQRADHGPLLAAARQTLQTAQARSEVETAFAKQHGRAARFLFTLLLEASDTPRDLLSLALAHREMTVRQMAIKACQALPAEQARPLLLSALERPGGSVRVNALRALLPLLDDPRPLLRRALLDASPAMRNLARWAAPSWRLDINHVIAERLSLPPPTNKREWLGLLGLASEQTVDLPPAWKDKALHSSVSSVRRAALETLKPEDLVHLLQCLDDPSDKVFFRAIALLNTYEWQAIAKTLESRLNKDWFNLPSNRRNALMQIRPSWQQLTYLVHRLEDSPNEKSYWLAQLNTWCEQQYLVVDHITPRSERQSLLQHVEKLESAGLLPTGTAQRLS